MVKMDGTNKNLQVFYKVRSDASSIEERAKAIAIEQSVETPLAAIRDPRILADIVGKVSAIIEGRDGWFDVEIELAAETVGADAGQLLNMLFGNASLYDDVILEDAVFPASLLRIFNGPRHGARRFFNRMVGSSRALTCSALKPQGLCPEELARLAYHLALGGIDYVKDDHGIADQSYSPFAQRVPACAAAVRKAAGSSGIVTRYVPNLSGNLRQIEGQLSIARAEGLDTVMIAPMLAGVPAFWALKQAHPDFAFIAHPAMTGAARVSPNLFAKLFRLFGADAVIFPNPGGRFGYNDACCGRIVVALRGPIDALLASLPVPAGGMSLARVPELLAYYGQEAMLLIGGALLSAPLERLAEETAAFVRAVADYHYE